MTAGIPESCSDTVLERAGAEIQSCSEPLLEP